MGSNGSLIDFDHFTDIKAAQGPLQPTAIDAQGVERIVGPSVDDNWRPAQVHPTEEQIAHMEAVHAHQAKRREERLGATQALPEHTQEGAAVTKGALEAENKAAAPTPTPAPAPVPAAKS
jgi:hypothetical protein